MPGKKSTVKTLLGSFGIRGKKKINVFEVVSTETSTTTHFPPTLDRKEPQDTKLESIALSDDGRHAKTSRVETATGGASASSCRGDTRDTSADSPPQHAESQVTVSRPLGSQFGAEVKVTKGLSMSYPYCIIC